MIQKPFADIILRHRRLTVLIGGWILLFLSGSGYLHQPDKTAASAADISWYSMEKAQEKAKESEKLVFVYAYAEWCIYCKKMEEKVFTVKSVQQTLEKYYYPVRVDIDSDDKLVFNDQDFSGRDFAQNFKVSATPTSFFIDGDGEILGMQPGFIPSDVFKDLLTYVGTGAYKEQKFMEYRQGREDDTGGERRD